MAIGDSGAGGVGVVGELTAAASAALAVVFLAVVATARVGLADASGSGVGALIGMVTAEALKCFVDFGCAAAESGF
ncbi:hypothetical protein MAIC_47290 [Mycolicibacterium aichiense]|uniref:Uncharacterized protein n=1 Tax=Mycolicibacterium aichiense TaxID=1799 RepID=A0AAD1HRX5_9MYCO|nr:hypothetical protein MAIC_47290 [Mycolicibacterium aichiense]